MGEEGKDVGTAVNGKDAEAAKNRFRSHSEIC